MATSHSQATTRQCPHCGTRNLSYAAFCISCGDILDEPSARNVKSGDGDLVAGTHSVSLLSRALLARWETWVGGLLMLGLLVYALVSWAHSTAQEDAYRGGQAAAANKDWDRAQASFREAGDLHDAARQVSLAGLQIEKRNSLYKAAEAQEQMGDWLGVTATLTNLQKVQPHYLDADKRLDTATNRLADVQLRGAAYRVALGEAPGIYVGTTLGVKRLPGSDAMSNIAASSSDGAQVVYDVPVEAASKLPLTGREGPAYQQPQPVPGARRLEVLARLLPSGEMQLMPAPELTVGGHGTFLENGPGLWWYAPLTGEQPRVAYYHPTAHAPGTAQAGGALDRYELVDLSVARTGRRVEAVDPAHGQIAATDEGGQGGNIYVASADGGDGYRVAAGVEGVEHITFSRDGAWLLFTQTGGGRNVTTSTYVVPVVGPGSRVLIRPRLLESFAYDGVVPENGVHARFISDMEDGLPRSKVLVIEGGAEELIALYDPTDFSTVYSLRRGRNVGSIANVWSSIVSHNGAYAALQRGGPGGATVENVTLPPGLRTPSAASLPVSKGAWVANEFSARDDFILSFVQEREADSASRWSLFATPVGTDGMIGAPLRIAQPGVFRNGAPRPAWIVWRDYVLYIDAAHQLRTVGYSGKVDVPLAGGVDTVWQLTASGQ